jgi:hypothetical protein
MQVTHQNSPTPVTFKEFDHLIRMRGGGGGGGSDTGGGVPMPSPPKPDSGGPRPKGF